MGNGSGESLSHFCMFEKMKIKGAILLLLFGFSACVYSQSDTVEAHNYEYEICVGTRGVEGIVLKNERLDITDTITALLKGTIYDSDSGIVVYASIQLKNITDGSQIGTITDTLGNYSLIVPSGNYSLKVSYVGYESVEIEALFLSVGEIREINLKFGTLNSFTTHLIKSKTPLSKAQLKKKADEFRIGN